MQTLVHIRLPRADVGAVSELRREGSSLENPYAYDSAAREIKALAERGLVAVVDEQTSGDPGMLLTTSIRFRKLR
jgi:hypothetical protein